MKAKIAGLIVFGCLLLGVAVVHVQAAGDGPGPWADSVFSSNQLNTKGGTPVSIVNPLRSNPESALGIAENDTVDGHFFSLGFGGNIVLRFDNPFSGGVIVVEATNEGYPDETALVEVSVDGITNWTAAGTVTQDDTVPVPEGITCAQYVRITDTSNRDNFNDFPDADAYDVDGVQVTGGESCTPPPVDVCPNIPENQPVLPEGYHYDEEQQCVPNDPTVTPTDVPPPPSNGGGPGDGLSDGRSDGRSSCPSCTAPPAGGQVLGASTGGQVLGASTDTLAATGSNYALPRFVISLATALIVFLLGHRLARVNETS